MTTETTKTAEEIDAPTKMAIEWDHDEPDCPIVRVVSLNPSRWNLLGGDGMREIIPIPESALISLRKEITVDAALCYDTESQTFVTF